MLSDQVLICRYLEMHKFYLITVDLDVFFSAHLVALLCSVSMFPVVTAEAQDCLALSDIQ